jgi:hypothetical protein
MPNTVQWATVPACMVPSAETAKGLKFVTTGGVVKFAVGKSGSIVFLAAITSSLPDGRYVLRANIERDDPTQANTEPSLLGTNTQLRRRRGHNGAMENLLTIGGGQSLPVLGGNGTYVVDSPGRDFDDGIDVTSHYYWVRLELQQAQPATAATRNAVMGLQLIA